MGRAITRVPRECPCSHCEPLLRLLAQRAAMSLAHAIQVGAIKVGLAAGVGSMSHSGWVLTKADAPFAPRGPFGASGTRYLLTLAIQTREQNARYGGVLGVCAGSGQGVAMLLENSQWA